VGRQDASCQTDVTDVPVYFPNGFVVTQILLGDSTADVDVEAKLERLRLQPEEERAHVAAARTDGPEGDILNVRPDTPDFSQVGHRFHFQRGRRQVHSMFQGARGPANPDIANFFRDCSAYRQAHPDYQTYTTSDEEDDDDADANPDTNFQDGDKDNNDDDLEYLYDVVNSPDLIEARYAVCPHSLCPKCDPRCEL
jgi:hypothetical protein